MTPEELDNKFDKIIQNLKSDYLGKVMVRVGVTALTMIKKRVTETGINAEGQKFAPYSTKPTLIGCSTFVQKAVCDSLLGSKEKRKQLEWRTVNSHRLAILNGGYKEIRRLQGRRTDITNFSLTNEMWNDINVVSNYSQHERGEAIIAAKTQINKDKLEGNTKKRGDILDLSEKEQAELVRLFDLTTLRVFKENGL